METHNYTVPYRLVVTASRIASKAYNKTYTAGKTST